MSGPRITATPERPLELAVVTPVLNEAGNIARLVAALEHALEGRVWELMVVDDHSADGTADLMRALARADPRLRILERLGRRGLSSAVVEGMLASAAPVLVVMDGDLQHDEGIIAALYAAVAEGGFDLAVGTRYADGGSLGGWDAGRRRISAIGTRWARRFLKADLTDPLSGFFAVRREAFAAAAPRLSGIGFKILMDLLASSPRRLSVVEIPYAFRQRTAGESKLDVKVGLEFVTLLLEKSVGRFVSVRLLSFMAVGAFGLAVHLAVLAMSLRLGCEFRVAQSLAVTVAIASNFVLNNSLTYRDMRLRGAAFWRGMALFYAVSLVGAVGDVGVGSVVYRLDRSWWLAGMAGVAVGVIWNYAVSSAVTWGRRRG